MDSNYRLPIDLTPIGIPIGVKHIEKSNCNPNLVSTNKIPKRFLCVHFCNTILSSVEEKLDGTTLERTTVSDGECYDLQQICDSLGKILVN